MKSNNAMKNDTRLQLNTYIVDAFTSRPFKGNPAGVCITKFRLEDSLMLSIAKELGFSETAFVRHINEEEFSIRYFSPKMEIPLCGHATIASSKVVFDLFEKQYVRFTTKSGEVIPVTHSASHIVMDFPVYETRADEAPAALLSALGIKGLKNVAYNRETNILLLEIESTDVLGQLNPNYEMLTKSHSSINGVLVTAASHTDKYDYHSRYFWPWSGTNEDPVTGGIQTFLASYWSSRLGKTKMRAFQSSSRTGEMSVELIDGKVRIKAEAVVILDGQMSLDIHTP